MMAAVLAEWHAAGKRWLARVRYSVANTPRSALVAGAVGTVALLGTLVGVLLTSPVTVVFVCVFVVTVGYGWLAHQALTVRALTLTMTASTILLLGLLIAFILVEAWPAFERESVSILGANVPGLGLLLEPAWRPLATPPRYSLVPMLHGTVVVTIIATAVAGISGVAAALFLSEVAPGWLRELLTPGIEILAGIPSIVYGFLGFTVLGPWVSEQFALNGQGTYLFVGIVVGLMALPTVVSVAESALATVPESMKQGSLALGTSDWQTMTTITLPAALSGVAAAVLLGIGRALGETMAATVMLRNDPRLADPLYNVFYGYETLTSLIAVRYGTADGEQLSILFAAGVVLFVTVLTLSVGAQLIEDRVQRTVGGDGR
jgi:phosphate transport system permease protein